MVVHPTAMSSREHVVPLACQSLGCLLLQVMGRKPEAEQSFSKALQLVKNVQSNSSGDPAILNKCKGLLSFIEARQMLKSGQPIS